MIRDWINILVDTGIYISGVLFLSGLIVASPLFFSLEMVWAQEEAPFKAPSIKDPKMRKLIAEHLGLSPDSPEIDFLSSMPEGKEVVFVRPDDLEEKTPPKIIAHYRGPYGRPLHAVPENRPVRPLPVFGPKEVAAWNDSVINSFREYAKAPPLPDCKDPLTHEKPLTVEPVSETVLMDLLYLRREDLPKNPKEAFGERARVTVYDPQKPSGGSITAGFLGVSCLPFRIRITAGKTYRALGAHALKNFDKPASASSLDEIESALNAQKVPPGQHAPSGGSK